MMRYVVRVFAFFAALALFAAGSGASAQCISYTQLTNGTPASASDVMNNFNTVAGCVRDKLTAARIYYVRTDGNDNCNGMADAGGSTGNCGFLAVTKALTVASGLDPASFQLTIQIDAGTFTAPISLPRMIGGLTPILTGAGSGTIISTSSDAITSDGGTPWIVQNLKITTTSGTGLVTRNSGVIKFSGIEFGAAQAYHMNVGALSSIQSTGNYTISGNAQYHIVTNGFVGLANGSTITLTGTPAFLSGFVVSNLSGASIFAIGVTFSGSATGQRYLASGNSTIYTAGGGANYFPGSTAGSTTTGGQYF